MRKLFILLLLCIGCSPKVYYNADVYLVNEDKIVYIWENATIIRQDKEYIYFVHDNTTHYVSGNLIIKPL